MNIKFLKIFSIILAAIVFIAEGLFVFVLPLFLNSKFEDKELLSVIKSRTNLDFQYTKLQTKTYPDFSIQFIAKDIELSQNKNRIFFAKDLDTRLSLLPVLYKKIAVKSLNAKNPELVFSRKEDNCIYLGDYKLNINLKPDTDINYDLNNIKIQNSSITINDKILNKNIKINTPSADFSFKKNRHVRLKLDTDIYSGTKHTSKILVDFNSKLPVEKGIKDKKFVCNSELKNLDLSEFSPYFAYFSKRDIISVSGIINADSSHDKTLNINASIKNFEVKMKNPLDNIVSKNDINLSAALDFMHKKLCVKAITVKSADWQTQISGIVKNYASSNLKNINLDLDINIPASDIHSMYWLVPSIEGDPFDVMQKFKKYGAWGKAKGQLKIKGSVALPEIYGNLEADDVYIVKDNPLVPHCKVFAEFLKDYVKVKTRVYAGHGEYVDIDGIAQMKFYGKGDFHIVSSKNVDLSTAEYMLVPIHEVVGFDLGPVPFMDIYGKGNIDIHTKGTILDGEVTGQFNFMNVTASLQGLNTVLHNTSGYLVFDKKDMHFFTTKAFIKDRPLKIDGKANLDGTIDFDITSQNIDIKELLNILNTSTILKEQKTMADAIEKASGIVETKIKLKGKVKDFSKIYKDEKLDISGSIKLKNVNAKIKMLPVLLSKTSGSIDFDNNGWNIDIKSKAGTSDVEAKGISTKDRSHISFCGRHIKIDEILKMVAKDPNFSGFSKLPKTGSAVNVSGEYKSNNALTTKTFSFNNISLNGSFLPQKAEPNAPVNIKNGSFSIHNGSIRVKNFTAKLYNTALNANIDAQNVFSKKPVISGYLNVSNFDLKELDTIKKADFLPATLKKLLNAYDNYQGNANISVKCRNNKLDGYVDLKEIKFNQSYFKTPVYISGGKILLKGSKISAKSIIAEVDNTPVFLNFSVWDLDKKMKFSGYVTTKITEYFINKYINSNLTYPLKPKGDISFSSYISGDLENTNIKTKIKLAKDADIYYMGANLADEDTQREIDADINVNNNIYNLKQLNYTRYMSSQNNKTYPLTILSAKGSFKPYKTTNKEKIPIYIKNLNIYTPNNANAKIFNVFFKKSVLKKGMFNCNLNIKGDANAPVIRGTLEMDNMDMPLFDTIVKTIKLNFNDKTIHVHTNGFAYNSDFTLKAQLKNKLTPPYEIQYIDLYSERLNLDTLIDSLTKIPTPDTVTRLTGGSTKMSIPLNISDIRIKKGTMSVKDIVIRNLPAKNYTSEFSLGNDLVLNINKLWFDVTTGKMTGTASYNFKNDKIKANVSALNVDSNEIASKMFGFKDQIFGQSNGNIVLATIGQSEEERIRNMSGYVYFEIADGKMPKLGSVEYLLKAGNFIKSGITGASISNFIDLLAPIKTGYFDSIKGNFAMKNGVAQNIEIYSKGDNLNIYINGEFDILQQYANLRVFGRLTKRATNILGKIGNMSFNSLLNAIPGFKLNKSDRESLIHDLNKIPGVELSDQQYRVFTVKIDGQINEDKYVKNFRWIE